MLTVPDTYDVKLAIAPSNSKGEQRNQAATSARLQSFLQEQLDGLPVWIRCPVRGPERFTGFSRAKLYQLDQARRIRSVSIREPGALRGVRFFHLGSILAFIESCEAASLAAASSSTPQTPAIEPSLNVNEPRQ